MITLETVLTKIIKCINSCNTLIQLENTRNWLIKILYYHDNYKFHYKRENLLRNGHYYQIFYTMINIKKSEIINNENT